MKCFFRMAFVVLAVSAGTVRAEIIGFLAPVGSRDTPEAAFLGDVPAGYTAWQLFARVEDTTDDGRPNGFIAAEL